MEKIPTETPHRFNPKDLLDFAIQLLEKGGLGKDRAAVVASTLLESDLMGHPTHGLALLSPYLQSLEKGEMATSGEPLLIRDTGASLTWDGQLLPGAWLTHKAIDLAFDRINEHPVVTVAIQKSHHIGCLAAYPERATQKGLMMILACSDPGYNRVAPFGGLTGVYSPNPIAAGIPTQTAPIIFDISTSTTAGGVVGQAHKMGELLPHPWLLDSEGKATNDPKTFYSDRPSTILPLGGLDTGYKGFALGILVEALTGALAGYGRRNEPSSWMSSVFLQVIDPKMFAGYDTFVQETQYFKNKSEAATTPSNASAVRLPGSRALALRDEQKKNGLVLNTAIIASLNKLGLKYDLFCPKPYN